MNKEDINSIINYWIYVLRERSKYNEFNNICTFIPLMPLPNNTSYNIIDTRSYNIIDTSEYLKNDNMDYKICYFVKKEHIQYAFTGYLDYSRYCSNIHRTATLLLENHNNLYGYYYVWLYALCTQIIMNKDKFPINNNEYFYNYIKKIFDFVKHDIFKNPDVNIYNNFRYNSRSTRVLPDGLLHTNFYCLDDSQKSEEINKILLTEILYILNSNYLIIFQPNSNLKY